MVLTVSFVLSSATNSFLSPSLSGLPATSPGWAGFASAQLDISNGCQDHTTSPYAATSTKRFGPPCAAGRSLGEGVEAPFVCALTNRSQPKLPCDHLLRANAAASTTSHPASVTTRDPPLVWVRRAELNQ